MSLSPSFHPSECSSHSTTHTKDLVVEPTQCDNQSTTLSEDLINEPIINIHEAYHMEHIAAYPCTRCVGEDGDVVYLCNECLLLLESFPRSWNHARHLLDGHLIMSGEIGSVDIRQFSH